MDIFVSKTSNTLNRQPYDIERITPNICLNPLYSHATTEFRCNVIMDSGAYQDEAKRVSYQQALERQQAYEKKLGYKAKYIVAYDKIGDREETMKANRFLLDQTLSEGQQKVLLVQGDTDAEYSQCLSELLELSKSHSFVLGLGGIAKASINTTIKERLYCAIIDNLSGFGNIKHIHLFGVLNEEIAMFFEHLLPKQILSVDTASMEIRSVMGNIFKDGKYVKSYTKEQKYIDYHPNTLAQDNIRRVLSYFGNDGYRSMNLCMGV
jgi:hypothetical protein